jgi:N-acetylglutamate synthase-like GNAT family acetyltransferase
MCPRSRHSTIERIGAAMATTAVHTNSLRWVHESNPCWDPDRERVFSSVPLGVFRAEARQPGERLSSDWWRVERDGRVVAYGWLDDVWGDAEILLAVEEGARGSGVGAFALVRLEEEAAGRGLNYVVNVVRDTHPDRVAVTAWLEHRGFTAAEDGQLRKQVGDRQRDIGQHQDGRPGSGRATVPDEERQARYAAERERVEGRGHAEPPAGSDSEPMGPGHEESGGYVDVDQHRY